LTLVCVLFAPPHRCPVKQHRAHSRVRCRWGSLEAADRSPKAVAKRLADRARDSEARAGREAAGTQKAHQEAQEAVGKRKRETSAERKRKRIEAGTQKAYEEDRAKRKRETAFERKRKRIEAGTQEAHLADRNAVDVGAPPWGGGGWPDCA
jgi:hypothetical protein